MTRNEFCEWHTIVVAGTEDDPEITVMHPGCPFVVDVGHGSVGFNYACQIGSEIDNAGFGTLLEDVDRTVHGWYRARMRHYTIRGFDWSEVDTEYEVEKLTPASVPLPPKDTK